MSGWVPMPAEVWEHVAPHLPLPWCEEAARFDLRWHYDQHGRLPSRRALAERWGWTPDEVRTELRHPERWWDPLQGPIPTSREAAGGTLTQQPPALTQRDPAAPNDGQAEADNTATLTHADPATPSADPASPQARRSTLTPPSPPPGTTDIPAPPGPLLSVVEPEGGVDPPPSPQVSAPSDAFAQALRAWNERVVPAAGVPPHPRLSPSRGVGQKLSARLREHGQDAVLLVLRWYARSPDDRAKFLRDKRFTLDTLVRPEKFDGYLAFALDWQARGYPTTDATSHTGRQAHTWRDARTEAEIRADDEAAERVARELEAEQQARAMGAG